jgi:aspartyl protease family protein
MNDPDKPADASKTIGRGMVIAAWIILLVLLTMFFNNRLDNQNNPNHRLSTVTQDGVPEVQLQRNRSGHYIATGLINGQAVEFMLDTGATDVSIPAEIADNIGLKRGRATTYQTANGTINAWQTTIDEVQLGPLRLGPIRASINPNDSSGAVLLGMSFLRHLDFSQQGNTLTLKYPDLEMD